MSCNDNNSKHAIYIVGYDVWINAFS